MSFTLRKGYFNLSTLPQFVKTSLIPYIGGLLALALFSNANAELDALFFTIAATITVKFLADITAKVTSYLTESKAKFKVPLVLHEWVNLKLIQREKIQLLLSKILLKLLRRRRQNKMKDLCAECNRKAYCMEPCEKWLIEHDKCPLCGNKLIHTGGCIECITGDWVKCG